ncbi:MAG: nitrogen fixation protein NifH, partial [Chloroflexi bacterium B3_Chlor]
AVMSTGPVPTILENQESDGYWVEPGPGYRPKYRSIVWSVSMLAQLGADGSDPGIQKACEYLLEHAIDRNGAFSASATQGGAILCLMGNLSAALLDLGWLGDERLHGALEWLARAVTGEGIAATEEKDAPLRYLKSGTCGPGFCCSANDKKPCAWGAVKVMLAFSKLPDSARNPLITKAIETGLEFLLSRDPAVADYPMGYSTKPSRSWFRFGFPIFYVTDVLQNLEVLTSFGYGSDPRLAAAMDLVLGKQDEQGRWKMEYTYNGKTWVDVEEKGKPSKWVTLRALRVLKRRGLGK